ncbi:unnamed protein product [Heterobilharzia americana]|nr:unnamed protein product [Heterobilharzia americana]
MMLNILIVLSLMSVPGVLSDSTLDFLMKIQTVLTKLLPSEGNLTCYNCIDCEHINEGTETKSGCFACLTSVGAGGTGRVNRECSPPCKDIQLVGGVQLSCCESDLCNSTLKINVDRKLILCHLLLFLIMKYVCKFL